MAVPAENLVIESWKEYNLIMQKINLSRKNGWVNRLIEKIAPLEQIGDEQSGYEQYEICPEDNPNRKEVILRWTRDFLLLAGEQWTDLGFQDNGSTERDLNNFKLLAFTRNPNLRTIRDLTGDHISHLQMMRDETEWIIRQKFPEVQAYGYRLFFHYNPSTCLLHINVELHDSPRQGHEFSFDHVIEKLEIPGYYQQDLEIFKFRPHK